MNIEIPCKLTDKQKKFMDAVDEFRAREEELRCEYLLENSFKQYPEQEHISNLEAVKSLFIKYMKRIGL
jgi:hypothetical protein